MTARDRTVLIVVGVAGRDRRRLAAGRRTGAQPRLPARQPDQHARRHSSTTARQQIAAGEAARSTFATNYTTMARLGEAVPADDDVGSLIVQVQAAANASRIDFGGLTLVPGGGGATPPRLGLRGGRVATAALPPGATVGPAGFPIEPFTFTFNGSFFHLSDFFGRLERFVRATNQRISVSGRLMTLNAISLGRRPARLPADHRDRVGDDLHPARRRRACRQAPPRPARRPPRRCATRPSSTASGPGGDRSHAMNPLSHLLSELRDRKLLPVAGLLLVAIIAVPVALSKTTSAPPAAPPAAISAGVPGAASLPAVSVRTTLKTAKLRSRAHDPFSQGSAPTAKTKRPQTKPGRSTATTANVGTPGTSSSSSSGSSQTTTTVGRHDRQRPCPRPPAPVHRLRYLPGGADDHRCGRRSGHRRSTRAATCPAECRTATAHRAGRTPRRTPCPVRRTTRCAGPRSGGMHPGSCRLRDRLADARRGRGGRLSDLDRHGRSSASRSNRLERRAPRLSRRRAASGKQVLRGGRTAAAFRFRSAGPIAVPL